MRIALVEFPPSGGLYQFAISMGAALAQAGHQVVVLTGPDPEVIPDQPGLRVISALPTWHPTAGADSPDWWRRARRGIRAGQHAASWVVTIGWLRRHRPDAVLWSSWRFGLDGYGMLAARKALPDSVLGLVAHEPVPLVEQPGGQALEKGTGGPGSVLGRAYAALDVAFTLGESAREVLIRAWQPKAPVVVFRHGSNEVLAQDVGSAESTGRHALFFGTITGYKGLDDLLAVWPAVRAALPDAQLTIAGNVSADVDQIALQKKVSQLDGVHLHAGYVDSTQVPNHFRAARAVLLPYRRSSQSGVAHLAFGFRRPVLATAVGDIPTVVKDGQNGWLIPPGDPRALTEAVIDALSDPVQAARFGDRGQQDLAAHSQWAQAAQTIGDALQQAQQARRAHR